MAHVRFLLHGGWDTILAAILFWLSPFITLFLVVNWVGIAAETQTKAFRLVDVACR
jgi:hypothetical protein